MSLLAGVPAPTTQGLARRVEREAVFEARLPVVWARRWKESKVALQEAGVVDLGPRWAECLTATSGATARELEERVAIAQEVAGRKAVGLGHTPRLTAPALKR